MINTSVNTFDDIEKYICKSQGDCVKCPINVEGRCCFTIITEAVKKMEERRTND